MNYAVLARRYARALYAIAKEKNLVTACQQGLDAFAAALEQSSDLRAILTRDRIAAATRKKIIVQVAATLQCDALVATFAQVVVAKGRALALPQIATAFAALANAEAGVVVAEVITAESVSDAGLLAAIRDKMTQVYSKKVQLTHAIDPQMIGGVVVRVGDEIFDGSVKAYLRRMRQQLLRAAA